MVCTFSKWDTFSDKNVNHLRRTTLPYLNSSTALSNTYIVHRMCIHYKFQMKCAYLYPIRP